MKQISERKPQQRSEQSQDHIFSENIRGGFPSVKSEDFYRGYLSLAFRYIYIAQIEQNDKRKSARGYYNEPYDIVHAFHHAAYAGKKIFRDGNIRNAGKAQYLRRYTVNVILVFRRRKNSIIRKRLGNKILIRSGVYIHITVNIIFTYTGNSRVYPFCVVDKYCYRISNGKSHFRRKFFRQNGFSFRWIRYFLFSQMKIDKRSDILIIGNDKVYILKASRFCKRPYRCLFYKHGLFENVVRVFFKILRKLAVRLLFKRNGIIIFKYVAILVFGYIAYRIPYSEPCKYKRRTAAYTEYHHKHSLFISEYIPCGDLVQKLHFAPDKSDFFEEYSFSRLRRFRAHKHRRHFGKFFSHRYIRRNNGAYKRNSNRYQKKRRLKHKLYLCKIIQHIVGFPYRRRK